MRPTLQAGDKVFLESVVPEGLRPSDVLAFKNPRDQIPSLHRLLWVGKTHVLTAGDAHWKVDSPVPFGNLLGRVARVEPGNRKPPFPETSSGLLRRAQFHLKKGLLKLRESDSFLARKIYSVLSFLWVNLFIRRKV